MSQSPEYTLIDTTDSLSSLVLTLYNLPTSPPSLYLDIEGENLGKNGTIDIIQIYALPLKHTYLIDVHVLKSAAFTTTSAALASAPSLKAILESPRIPKCLFDVRADSNALFFLYGVSIQGVQDIQLMELARRPGLYVNGLVRCIERDAGLNASGVEAFQRKKREGSNLFLPDKGGSWEALRERPMKAKILDYCVQDVKHLPVLWQRYKATDRYWQSRIESAVLERIKLSKDPGFDRTRLNMAMGPWGDPVDEFLDEVDDYFEDDYFGREDDNFEEDLDYYGSDGY